MDSICLLQPTVIEPARILEYRAAFPDSRMQVTLNPARIPGLDYLEQYENVLEWLRFCREMAGKISWYMSVRERDGIVVGAACLRHALEYDDDDIDFASHIGYSIRPDTRGAGYGTEQLRLVLCEASVLGLQRVRLVCRDINVGSNRVILANGGIFIDSIYGEESGMTINRYDIPLA